MIATSTEIRLRPRSGSSYDVNDVEGFAAWLLRNGCTPERPRSRLEYGRYHSPRGALIVIYHSAAVVLQGAGIERAKQALQRFVVEVN